LEGLEFVKRAAIGHQFRRVASRWTLVGWSVGWLVAWLVG